MTISKTHSINLLGLHNAMNELHVINPPAFALLYFVVPPDVQAVFANPTPVVAGGHNNPPNNVHMIVLEIPWPEQVGHKRKVSLVENQNTYICVCIMSPYCDNHIRIHSHVALSLSLSL